jgi:hypothetical protein
MFVSIVYIAIRDLTYQYESSLQQSPNCEPSHVMLRGMAPLALPHRPLIDKANEAVSFEETLVEDTGIVDEEEMSEDEISEDDTAEDEVTEDEGRTPMGAES